MTLYIFSALKTLRDIVPPSGLTGLVHDESAYTVSATIPMDLTVVPGEHIGFMCVDGRFRMFTVTKAENKDFDATTIITGIDTAVQELKETIVPELQQLEVNLHDSVVALLDASDARSSWSVTGSGPADLKKHRAYYTSMWTMLETLAQLYEWRIIPHYYFASGAITGRTIELAADTATFRGRILQSKKDASNVYVIKSTPPITRLYGLGPSKSQEPGVSENLTFAEAEWSTAAGDPANKPKEQTYVDDPAAVAKYGVRSSTVQFDEVEDEKDLLQKTWNHLQTIKEPTCTVEATVQDLEQVPGYETKIIRLGDLVPVRLSNAAMEEARVIGIKRDYVKPWLTKVTIGDKTASLSTQVTSLMTNALHTHETLTIYKNRFHEDEALIQLNAQFVQANAERIELNADLIELNAKQIALNAEQIQLNADQIELNAKNIALNAEKIQLNADQIELNAKDIALNAENIALNAEKIQLNADQIEVNANAITVNANAIAVNAEDISVIAGRVDVQAETITAQAKLISAKADQVDLEAQTVRINAVETTITGLVKTEDLETEVLEVLESANIVSLTVTNLNSYSVNGGSATFDNVSADWFTMGGSTVATEDWVEEQGFLKAADGVEGSIATQEWVQDQGYATQAWVNNKDYVLNSSLPSILISYATKNWVNEQGYLKTIPSTYATQSWVQSQGYLKSVPSNYATQAWVLSQSYASQTWVEDKGYLTEIPSGYATQDWVAENFSKASVTYKPTVIERYGLVFDNNISVRALNAAGTVLMVGTIDAGDVYEAGEDSVTLSAGEWASNKMTVTASNGKTLEVDATSIVQAGTQGGFNVGYEMAIVGALIELDGTTVKVYSPDGAIAGPTLDISSNLDAAYDDGYADATPTGVDRTATYNSADNTYSLSIKVKSADGSSRDFTAVALNAAAAYNAGYKAAKDSATFSVDGTNVVVTFGDGTTKTLDAKQYVTVSADVQYVSSTATTMTVRGWGYAYFNDVYCVGASRNQTYDTAD